ncbi:hypothetical protein HYV12_02610 [Candidatus Dojkabacteria bacterium]|nr:hypothetical protein [Candidatus Dojkabacteria bacterium]
MGYMVELNTLLGLPNEFETKSLAVGKQYNIVKSRERAFPLHIAVLMVDTDWNFYGYAVVHSAVVKDLKTEFTFEVISLFEANVRELYKQNFIFAAKKTGEVK